MNDYTVATEPTGTVRVDVPAPLHLRPAAARRFAVAILQAATDVEDREADVAYKLHEAAAPLIAEAVAR